ncbi:hypothetical protein AB4Y80_01570 [Specibacter sp. RAF43]
MNTAETYRRRVVRGLDINDWHLELDAWFARGNYWAALDLLAEIMDAVETLEQFDDWEPEAYWYEQAAEAHTRIGEHDKAVAVLERWLQFWPPERIRFDMAPQRMQRKLDAARTRVARIR